MSQTPLSAQTDKIWQVVAKATKPLSAYEILDRLRQKGVRSPPTVYRALKILEARGFIHRIESLNAFVACSVGCAQHAKTKASHQEDHTSAFAICRSCGRVEELRAPALDEALSKAAKGFLQTTEKQSVEIVGLCMKCATQEKGRKKCSR
ncbi:MAG: transcriptional repressor [Proteobacteria bacterium]|jgi:Fur family zinc uptake transcriptional regulator|nr:Fur family transcriptional regulator [Alphaproteobacteria bacterium]NCC03498.1 transcriptional repressor [Pseudomonadota bacterium]